MIDHEENELIVVAKHYAIAAHEQTNHKYNGFPYAVHLALVVYFANKFIHLVPESERENVIAACWAHDMIEDTRQTYSDVKKVLNETVADLVYALTNEKGKTRKERANDKYYEGIRKTPNATFIKVCDRMANYFYSVQNESKMAEMYEKEMEEFISKLYDVRLDVMFTHLKIKLQPA